MSDDGAVVEFRGVDLQRLRSLAIGLHRHLPPQVVIALQGTLGAGKTRFAQEIAVAAGIDVGDVTSPTFTLVQHYEGSRRIHHVDAYRLADEDEFIELGGEELFDDEALVLVEWPQRIARSLPGRTLFLEIEIEEHAAAAAAASPADPQPAPRTIRARSSDAALLAVLRTIQSELPGSDGASG